MPFYRTCDVLGCDSTTPPLTGFTSAMTPPPGWYVVFSDGVQLYICDRHPLPFAFKPTKN